MRGKLKVYQITDELASFPVGEGETLGELIEAIGWTSFVDALMSAKYPEWQRHKQEAVKRALSGRHDKTLTIDS